MPRGIPISGINKGWIKKGDKLAKRMGKVRHICLICNKEFYLYPAFKLQKMCSRKCSHIFMKEKLKGKNCYNWKGGIKIAADGYKYIYQGNRNYVAEHRLIWKKKHGKLPDGYVVHHLNGEKCDNRIENLQAISRKHHSPRKIIEPYQKRIKELEEKLRRLL